MTIRTTAEAKNRAIYSRNYIVRMGSSRLLLFRYRLSLVRAMQVKLCANLIFVSTAIDTQKLVIYLRRRFVSLNSHLQNICAIMQVTLRKFKAPRARSHKFSGAKTEMRTRSSCIYSVITDAEPVNNRDLDGSQYFEGDVNV